MAETKMYDLGRSLRREGMAVPFVGEGTSKTIYPSVSLSSQEFPPLKDWQVGQTYEVTIKVKMIGMHEREKYRQSEFDVLSARV